MDKLLYKVVFAKHLLIVIIDKKNNTGAMLHTESSSADHVIDTAGCSYNDVDAVRESMQILTYVSASNTRLTLSIHVVS